MILREPGAANIRSGVKRESDPRLASLNLLSGQEARDDKTRATAENAAAMVLERPLEHPAWNQQDSGFGFWTVLFALLSIISHRLDVDREDEIELQST